MCENMNIDFDDCISLHAESDDELLDNHNQNYAFVDVQGFKTFKNRFICKEFCLIDGDDVFHVIIKSPYNFERLSSHYRSKAQWLTEDYHGLPFNCGSMDMIEMKQKVFPKVCNKTILVKGTEKANWLRHIFRDCGEINCVNVEDLNFNHIHRFGSYQICENHNSSSQKQYVCAKSNAILLQNWCKMNSQ